MLASTVEGTSVNERWNVGEILARAGYVFRENSWWTAEGLERVRLRAQNCESTPLSSYSKGDSVERVSRRRRRRQRRRRS